MAKRVRRQHVVSRFYLKGFANEASQIRRVALPGDNDAIVLSTGDATVIKDFYTITLPDGAQSDAFEHALADVETPASEALRGILDGSWPIRGETRAVMATWIALQHLRSEDLRSSRSEYEAQMIRLLVGVSGKEPLRHRIEVAEGRSVSDDELDWEWEDLTKPGGPDLVPDTADHLRLLLSMVDGTSHFFHHCHWTLYRFTRRALLTSDHPVSLLSDQGGERPWLGVGLATADLFLVPLSRRVALTIQPRERLPTAPGVDIVPDFRVAGTTVMARSINQETAARARRYVYHHPDDSPLDGIVLSEPERRQWQANADHFIREEGFFQGVSAEQQEVLSPMGPEDDSNSMSIADLPWPIPGRRKPCR